MLIVREVCYWPGFGLLFLLTHQETSATETVLWRVKECDNSAQDRALAITFVNAVLGHTGAAIFEKAHQN